MEFRIFRFAFLIACLLTQVSCEEEKFKIKFEEGNDALNTGLRLDDLQEATLQLLLKDDQRFTAIDGHEEAIIRSRSAGYQDSLLNHFVSHFESETNLYAFLDQHGTPQWNHYMNKEES